MIGVLIFGGGVLVGAAAAVGVVVWHFRRHFRNIM